MGKSRGIAWPGAAGRWRQSDCFHDGHGLAWFESPSGAKRQRGQAFLTIMPDVGHKGKREW